MKEKVKCNSCGNDEFDTFSIMDFKYHKCRACGNEQKIYGGK
jgi:ribosomal protein S27E